MIYLDYKIGDLVTEVDGTGIIYKINYFEGDSHVGLIHKDENITKVVKYITIRPLTEMEKSSLVVNKSLKSLVIFKISPSTHDKTTLNLVNSEKKVFVFDFEDVYSEIKLLNSYKYMGALVLKQFGSFVYFKKCIHRLKYSKSKSMNNSFSYSQHDFLVNVHYRIELLNLGASE